jgi:murein DD-endopeptidase MepM/ murein hydrolase activator NlpD
MRILSIAMVLLFLFVFSWNANPQSKYPKNYFRSPVDFGIFLSGSFGEVRKNHFHSGIDIRTEGVSGKPVRAIADGYVQRINISPTGFGKALYIAHANGFVSVYGHLDKFNQKIQAWTRTEQYKQESFALDISVQPGVLPVKKGDIIAYSGNSGSSGGPHLHFEIRDAGTQETINPLLFGLSVKDFVPPRIYSVRIYPYGDNSLVNFADNPLALDVSGSDGRYSVRSQDTVRVTGNIIFGIEAFDYLNDSELKTGITTIELKVDTTKYFSLTLDRFSFAETRYVNSIIDYSLFIKAGKKIQRSYVAPNNKMSIYSGLVHKGVVNFVDSRTHKVQYIVKDVYGNKSELTFWVKSHPPPPAGRFVEKKPEGTLFSCRSDNHFANNDLIFELPEGALYEDLYFLYSTSEPLKGGYSKVHHLHNETVPVQSSCHLSIKTEGLPKNVESKALIVKVEGPSKYSSRGGKWDNGFIKTQVKEFGDYMVMVDTTAPTIRPVNVSPGKKLSKQSTIKIKISDNLAGIKSYRGILNGKWILMDYDAKNQLLTYSFDDRIRTGKNDFILTVRDNSGNEAVYKASLIK